ncbi:MAG: phytanoyl-CoA dioxygenase family protein [Acidimicrobiales bacterium]|jgi:hypothetical protein|nr:phytanoyl-CoA dioxygenase family protein [Acidimicrobiales bacterium]
MTGLVERYAADGYFFPVDVLDPEQARTLGEELLAIRSDPRFVGLGNNDQFNHPHLLSRAAADLVRHPVLLEVAESLLGPDLLVWGATLFAKPPHSGNYVSWHQDLHYWGFDCDDEVSAWVALGPVTEASGCMRFARGSHVVGGIEHNDTFAPGNSLTRGQEAMFEVNEDDVVLVELASGQASFHHGRLLHGSGPNGTDDWRLGLAIQYIGAHVRQVATELDYAMPVRGVDRFHNFAHVSAPDVDLSPESLAWHRRVMLAQNDAIYESTEDVDGAVR